MRTMSNNQWDSPQGEGQWKPQGEWNPAAPHSAGERDQSQAQPSGGDSSAGQQGQDWDTGAQPQPSAGDWNTGAQPQPSARDWNTGAPRQEWNTGAQPQPSAGDWNASQGWNTGAQPQPPSGNWNASQGWNAGAQPQPPSGDWSASQGWNTGATAHQSGWGDPHQQGGLAPGYEQQQWQQQQQQQQQQQEQRQPRTRSAFGNVFDFSFRKFALPEAAGTIFLIAIIAIGVWWLVDVVTVLTLAGGPYGAGPGTILQSLIGGVAQSLVYVLAARVLLEGMSALVMGSRGKQAEEPTRKADNTNPDSETA